MDWHLYLLEQRIYDDELDRDYSLDYPDNDTYCPECAQSLSYVERGGVYVLMCNHCGWPRNRGKATEEASHEAS